VIVDPYNEFMSEGGKFYEATRKTAEAVGLYDNMRKLIPAIRAGCSNDSRGKVVSDP